MRICKNKKNQLNFFRHFEKLGGFVFYKVDLTWRKIKTIKKDEVEEKEEEWLHEKIHGVSLNAERISMSVV
jgi:threonyl-tRNA synthetase